MLSRAMLNQPYVNKYINGQEENIRLMEIGNSRNRRTMACLNVHLVGEQENRKNYDTVNYIRTRQPLDI
jgi:hypothetical protein